MIVARLRLFIFCVKLQYQIILLQISSLYLILIFLFSLTTIATKCPFRHQTNTSTRNQEKRTLGRATMFVIAPNEYVKDQENSSKYAKIGNMFAKLNKIQADV